LERVFLAPQPPSLASFMTDEELDRLAEALEKGLGRG
jgi:hypothetical protein